MFGNAWDVLEFGYTACTCTGEGLYHWAKASKEPKKEKLAVGLQIIQAIYSIKLSFLQIDEGILQEVVKMGFDRNQLIESLCNGMQNEA